MFNRYKKDHVMDCAQVILYTECLTLNVNKIKHYISKMKPDIKLCAISFSVI